MIVNKCKIYVFQSLSVWRLIAQTFNWAGAIELAIDYTFHTTKITNQLKRLRITTVCVCILYLCSSCFSIFLFFPLFSLHSRNSWTYFWKALLTDTCLRDWAMYFHTENTARAESILAMVWTLCVFFFVRGEMTSIHNFLGQPLVCSHISCDSSKSSKQVHFLVLVKLK